MKKKFLSTILTAILCANIIPSALADNISVTVNGENVKFDQPPIIDNGRTLVPLRAIFEALGAEVTWEDSIKTATALKDDISVSISIGSNNLSVNNNIIPLDVPAKIVNGRTLVPARAIAESFGCDVNWNGTDKIVSITSNETEELDVEEYMNNCSDKLDYGKNFVALVKANSTLWVWGANNAPTLDFSYNGETIKTPRKIMDNVTAVSCGYNHIMVLKEDGSLWTWGLNDYGQVGNASYDPVVEPQKIMDNIISIAAGGIHSLALDKNGILYGWGNGINTEESSNSNSPQIIAENVQKIGAGNNYSIYISDNTAYIDGKFYSTDGNNSKNKPHYEDIIDIVDYDEGFKLIYPDNSHKFYSSYQIGKNVTLPEKIYTFGEDYRIHYSTDENKVFSKTSIYNKYLSKKAKDYIISDIHYMVESPRDFCIAIANDGSVWSWGLNQNHVLGTGDRASTKPTKIIDSVFDNKKTQDKLSNSNDTDVSLFMEYAGSEDYVAEIKFTKNNETINATGQLSITLKNEDQIIYSNKQYLYESSFSENNTYIIEILKKDMQTSILSNTGVLEITFETPGYNIHKEINVSKLPITRESSDVGISLPNIDTSSASPAMYEYYNSKVKNLETQLQNVMNNRNQKVFINGSWQWTHDVDKANKIKSDIAYYKALRDACK